LQLIAYRGHAPIGTCGRRVGAGLGGVFDLAGRRERPLRSLRVLS
jgi:hypothetical protein